MEDKGTGCTTNVVITETNMALVDAGKTAFVGIDIRAEQQLFCPKEDAITKCSKTACHFNRDNHNNICHNLNPGFL